MCIKLCQATLLLVDDEVGVQLLYKEEFEDLGYKVISAYNGEQALDLLMQFIHLGEPKIDIVILDINMPGMSGIEVLRRIKEMKSELPVILSSAYQEYRQNFGSWACEEYIVKSASMNELKDAVKRNLK